MRGVAGVCVLLGIPAASGLLQCLTAQPRVRLPAAPAHFCRAAVAACEAPPPSPAPPSPSQLSVKTYKPSALPATGRAGSLRTRLDELRALTSQHGVALPSAANGSPPSLIRWASRQRMLRRTGALSDSMVDELDELGFVWDPLMHAWEQRLEELEAFAAENGHASPPVDYAQSPGLPAWVARQRVLHKRGELLSARREALEQLGFEFDPSSAKWEQASALTHPRRAKRVQDATHSLSSHRPPCPVSALLSLRGTCGGPALAESCRSLCVCGRRGRGRAIAREDCRPSAQRRFCSWTDGRGRRWQRAAPPRSAVSGSVSTARCPPPRSRRRFTRRARESPTATRAARLSAARSSSRSARAESTRPQRWWTRGRPCALSAIQ